METPVSEVDQIVANTSGKGCGFVLYLAPTVMFAFVLVLYAWFGWYVYDGRPADGNRVHITVSACEAADEALEARLSQMGLEPSFTRQTAEQVLIDVVLPSDERIANAIPVTLVEPGQFEVRSREGDTVLVEASEVQGALARLNVMMQPRLGVGLSDDSVQRLRDMQQASPNEQVSFWLDGQRIGGQNLLKQFSDTEVEVALSDADERLQMEKIAGWAVSVGTPLPCPARVISTEPQPST